MVFAVLFVVPLIHLFVSTSRMAREAEERSSEPEPTSEPTNEAAAGPAPGGI